MYKYKEPESMREVHEMQLKVHEEMKGLTFEEKVAKMHKTAQHMMKKYGLKFKKHKVA